jgi:hypothetical protein
LMGVPVNSTAHLVVTTDQGEISSELIATEVRDYDGDGLFNELEAVTKTFPWDADTDNDGLLGGPFFSEDLNANGIADPGKTDPRNPDSDGDGLWDGEEDGNHNGAFEPERGETDPGTADTDGNGVIDSIDNCPNAFNPDQLDSDGDGIGNSSEEAGDADGDAICERPSSSIFCRAWETEYLYNKQNAHPRAESDEGIKQGGTYAGGSE